MNCYPWHRSSLNHCSSNNDRWQRWTHTYLQDLSKYGITTDHVAQAGCYAYDLAAWRVRQHIKNDKGDIWTKAANYHSRTPEYNAKYRADLIAKASKWADWLEAHFQPNHKKIPENKVID